MANKYVYITKAYTFKENSESETLNLAESALNKQLFLTKKTFEENGFTDIDLTQVKITIEIEKI